MSKRENYEARTEELLKPIAEANHVDIYDIEYVKEGSDWYLRCYIDKEEGVNINDCEAVSRALSDELDRTDFIEDAYILEVSSPGLGRALKKDKHFEKSLGMEVDLKTYKPINGSKEFTGILKAFDAETVTLVMGGWPEDGEQKASSEDREADEEAGEITDGITDGVEEMRFDRKEIASIKLTLDF